MKQAKADFRISQRRNGRWMVTKKGGKVINGDEKLNALVAAGKLKAPAKKAAEPAAEEASSEAAPSGDES